MSSTSRGSVRHVSDYYVTPIPEIEKFINIAKDIINPDPFTGKKILDPCAGGDKNHEMSYPKALAPYSEDIFTIDIREDSLAERKVDYLGHKLDFVPDTIITNPPFAYAQEIILKALQDVKKNGYVVMLCRLNFLGSKKRFKFWQHNMPMYIFVHSERMSFTGDGKRDSIEYAHFVWKNDGKKKLTRLILI